MTENYYYNAFAKRWLGRIYMLLFYFTFFTTVLIEDSDKDR